MKQSALINQQPIVVTPCMVKVYGATTALFAQQLWYWQQKSENLIDGRYWVYNTAKEWGNQIGVDEKTIRRSVAKLKAAGVLYVGNYNKAAYDRTAWYSLDGELVAEQTEKCLNEYQKSDYPKRPNGSGQNVHMELPETPAPIPETTTKTTHIYEKAKAFPDAGSSFDEKEKKNSAKRKEKELLQEIINIINPREKVTASKLKDLSGRLKEFSPDEIRAAATAFSKSTWHKENNQMLVTNLIRASKFERWYSESQNVTQVYVPTTDDTLNRKAWFQQ